MKASEILHGLAELLAGIETGQAQELQPNRAELVQVDVDNTDSAEAGKFVPPLQAKLEILKKSVGLDNVYGNGEGQEQDELGRMRQMAGLSAAQQDAADDEPLDV
jgi:hypothetical protein